jgi:hypothetical protein
MAIHLPEPSHENILRRNRARPGDQSLRWFRSWLPGAHSQGATLDELNANLREVLSMLLEDGEPVLESEFVGVQNVAVA